MTRRRKAERKLFLTAVKKKATKKKTYATVNTKKDPLTIRSAANAKSKELGKIPKRTKVEVVKKGASWTKVKYKTTTGYVATKYLK